VAPRSLVITACDLLPLSGHLKTPRRDLLAGTRFRTPRPFVDWRIVIFNFFLPGRLRTLKAPPLPPGRLDGHRLEARDLLSQTDRYTETNYLPSWPIPSLLIMIVRIPPHAYTSVVEAVNPSADISSQTRLLRPR
jgi:hypothetical protein